MVFFLVRIPSSSTILPARPRSGSKKQSKIPKSRVKSTASTAIGQAIKATKATKQARNAKEVSASSDEPKNPFRGLPHPTKVCKDGVTPRTKTLTKAEKKQASDWDQGREECQEWFLKCTEPDAKHKKAQVPQTILDKVCWAINEAMPNDGRAMAYIPQTAQSQEGYVQNSRGRKRAVAKSAADKVTGKKTLFASMKRDRRNAWLSLKTCPIFMETTMANKRAIGEKLLILFNERYRRILWEEFQQSSVNSPDTYSMLGDRYISTELGLDDKLASGRCWPLPVPLPAYLPSLAAHTVFSFAASNFEDNSAVKKESGKYIGELDSEDEKIYIKPDPDQEAIGEIEHKANSPDSEHDRMDIASNGEMGYGDEGLEAESKMQYGDLEKADEHENGVHDGPYGEFFDFDGY